MRKWYILRVCFVICLLSLVLQSGCSKKQHTSSRMEIKATNSLNETNASDIIESSSVTLEPELNQLEQKDLSNPSQPLENSKTTNLLENAQMVTPTESVATQKIIQPSIIVEVQPTKEVSNSSVEQPTKVTEVLESSIPSNDNHLKSLLEAKNKDTSMYYVITITLPLTSNNSQNMYSDHDSLVLILDSNLTEVKRLEHCLTRNKSFSIKGNQPFEIGKIMDSKEEVVKENCYGWYSIEDDRFLLPQEYKEIKQLDTQIILTERQYVASSGEYTHDFNIYDTSQNKVYQSKELKECKRVSKNGDYYWLDYVKENNYVSKIYNEQFQLQRTIDITGQEFYNSDGTVRCTNQELLKKIGLKELGKQSIASYSKAYCNMRTWDLGSDLCLPESVNYYTCYVSAVNDEDYHNYVGYLLNDQMQVTGKINPAGDRHSVYDWGSVIFSDGLKRECYDRNGYRMVGEDGVKIEDFVTKSDQDYFYGADDTGIHLYDDNMQLISVFEWGEHLHGPYDSVSDADFWYNYEVEVYEKDYTLLINLMKGGQYELVIYHKDQIVYTEVFDQLIACEDFMVQEDGTFEFLLRLLYLNNKVYYKIKTDGEVLRKEDIIFDNYIGFIQGKVLVYNERSLSVPIIYN